MTGRTHDLAGFTLLHIVIVSLPIPSMSIATAIGGLGMVFIGALTPDIDQPTADLWRRLPAGNIIGRMISPILGSHRMVSHSIVGTALFAYGSYALFERLSSIILVDMTIIWYTFMIGYISHLIMDFFNRDGLPLLFPIPWHFGFPPLKKLRLRAGGMMEKTVIYPLLLAANAYLVSQHAGQYIAILKQITY